MKPARYKNSPEDMIRLRDVSEILDKVYPICDTDENGVDQIKSPVSALSQVEFAKCMI